MALPAVSVILPFYNAQATLARALDSITTQTFTDWELIAFDDGSTDASRTVAERCAAQDPRIRVLGTEHLGIVGALQAACDAARAPMLARMDADDESAPERLAQQTDLMERRPELGLCGTLVRVRGNVGTGLKRYETWLNALVSGADIDREIFIECPLAHPSFLLRRSAYEAVGGYRDIGWAEDYDLVLRLWQHGWPMAKVPGALLDWHTSTTRLSLADARYSEPQFRAAKRHFLAQTCLAENRPFHQWGAGDVGKRWLREWGTHRPITVVDINPRKIGRTIHNTLVIAPEALPPPGPHFLLIAVGAPGARQEIRDWLTPRGYREPRDYRFVA